MIRLLLANIPHSARKVQHVGGGQTGNPKDGRRRPLVCLSLPLNSSNDKRTVRTTAVNGKISVDHAPPRGGASYSRAPGRADTTFT
jgi:hypothetical protein